MIRLLAIVIILLVSSQAAWSQITINGKVISKYDKTSIPGVIVAEKGTENITTTNHDGTFSINVTDPNSTLVFSFIGMITQEHRLKGKDYIIVETKWDCNKDFFDSKNISIYATSGLINTPIGGQIEVASPYIFGGVVKGMFNYQTDTDQNNYQNGQVELSHFISNCDFDIDFRWSYRQTAFINNFNASTHSFETDLNLSGIKLIAGYSHLDLHKNETTKGQSSSGVLIGFGKTFGQPIFPSLIGKVSLYRDNIEYQAYLQGSYKSLLFFTKFYKLNSFNEISLGIGTSIGYRIKRPKI